MSRKLKFIVTASILLNLLLAGAVAGMTMRDSMRHGPYRGDMEKMSRPGRRLTHESFEQSRRGIAPLFAQAHDLRDRIVANITAPRFDTPSYLKDAEDLRAVQAKMMTERARVAAEVAGQLSQDDRKAIAEWLAGTRPPPPASYGERSREPR